MNLRDPIPYEAPGTGPTGAFLRQVRDALTHLYDPAYLLLHPLVGQLVPASGGFTDAAQALRDVLIDAIEALEPRTDSPTYERDRRPYQAMMSKYVDGMPTEEVLTDLNISLRQFQREHQKGLRALAAYLWPRRSKPASSDESSAVSLNSEIRRLGVSMEEVALSRLLEELREPVEALARHLAIDLHLSRLGGDQTITCDQTLTRQAVITAVGALSAQGPTTIGVTAIADFGRPCLRLESTPSVLVTESLASAVETCRSLMAVQGGEVGLSRDQDRQCKSITLSLGVLVPRRVLVIDDDPGMLRFYERYLTGDSWMVTVAASAAEAQRALADNQPDAIVLDVMMRDVDGWTLLQSIRSCGDLHHVPIVVCSVLADRDMAVALGAQACVRKPFLPEELRALIARLLSGSSREEQHRLRR